MALKLCEQVKWVQLGVPYGLWNALIKDMGVQVKNSLLDKLRAQTTMQDVESEVMGDGKMARQVLMLSGWCV